MKDTITVRKEHYPHLKNEFKSFAVDYAVLSETPETYEIEIETRTLQQFYSAVFLASMVHSFKKSEGFIVNAVVNSKPFSESELTQL